MYSLVWQGRKTGIRYSGFCIYHLNKVLITNATEIPKTNTAVVFFFLRKPNTFCIVKYSKCFPLTSNFHYVSVFLHSEISRISMNGNLHLIIKLLDGNLL